LKLGPGSTGIFWRAETDRRPASPPETFIRSAEQIRVQHQRADQVAEHGQARGVCALAREECCSARCPRSSFKTCRVATWESFFRPTQAGLVVPPVGNLTGAGKHGVQQSLAHHADLDPQRDRGALVLGDVRSLRGGCDGLPRVATPAANSAGAAIIAARTSGGAKRVMRKTSWVMRSRIAGGGWVAEPYPCNAAFGRVG